MTTFYRMIAQRSGILKERVILGSGKEGDGEGNRLVEYGTYFNAPGHPIYPKVLVEV
jgi:hypothetical protein